MSIDQYAPCPCGNGKKVKFCKCVDNAQDLEKVYKLIQGGQAVAALDRINQLLQEAPNTAWLLATKSELSLQLQEFEVFIQTSERFLQLKPDNPLALSMKSMAVGIERGPAEEAARYLLDSFAESREDLHPITLTSITMLLGSLRATGDLSVAGFWINMFENLASEEVQAPFDKSSLNLLCRTPVTDLPIPRDAPYRERMTEVGALTKTFRYGQAESKLRAILRDFPDSPGPLSALLICQLAQLNRSGVADTARKLSVNKDVSEENRLYYGALALEVSADDELHSPQRIRYHEIADDEAAIQLLRSNSNTFEDNGDEGKRVQAAIVGDEVPAKCVFSVFDGSIREPGDHVSHQGTVAVFGKQTDRPCRVLVLASNVVGQRAEVDEIIESLDLGAELELSKPASFGFYTTVLERAHVKPGETIGPIEKSAQAKLVVRDCLNMPLNLFDGKSPLEIHEDESQRFKLLCFLYHLECSQVSGLTLSAVHDIYSGLDLEIPKSNLRIVGNEIKLDGPIDLLRFDFSSEDVEDQFLLAVYSEMVQLGSERKIRELCGVMYGRPELMKDPELRSMVIGQVIGQESNPDRVSELIDELYDAAIELKAPVGQIVLEKMGMLASQGKDQEAQLYLVDKIKKHPDDPYLLSFLQRVQGMQQPGGVPPAASPVANDSGLVLPGNEPSAPAQGESKLWIPGS
ncbi:MAG TPA: hypothetical protein DDW52_01320 [Planctomycetaceae bacterium]|nr:hypothetical protein [Planctomycetaceae bacterium]